ncbi:DEAD/DEAH box helicase [Occultella aeris]|uniref:ATP-dependent RNA helicase RhlE n=1 Tax=Occultella aeris TaxID=2761496 RepID=A0A7M4DFZ0_9MICO|nr:DEAD/DEAH box helicase [Occultella aeris]VZO35833.1 ATP-dependent RNA helicase RhlE [Occultella aeris]
MTPAQTPSFSALGVPAALVKSLTERGITEPFPIQTATLRDTLAGRDVLGRGRTGSGKTIAFAVPLVARLTDGRRAASRKPRGLVLAPTRELASQIGETIAPLAAAAGLRHTVIFGGVGQGKQVTALNDGVDILIACPGRLEDLKGQGHLNLDNIEIAVLDEADHMADLGFLPAVKRIMDATPRGGQRMLFSATLDNGVDIIVKRYLTDPLTHSVDSASSPVAAMEHHIFEVSGADAKRDLIEQLAAGTSRRLLFTRTKHQAKKLARQLTASGIPAVDLHGNLSQNARERNLDAFSTGAVKVLVATDIAARGIHVDDVELVVHVDPPAEHKAYLHRSGRTARAGSGGTVVTLMLPEQRGDVRQLTRAAKITASPVRPDAAAVAKLVGDVAVKVDPARAPAAAATAPAPSGPGRGRSGSGGRGGERSGAGARTGGRSRGARSQGEGAGSRSGGASDGGRSGGGRSGAPTGGGRSGGGRSGGGRSGAPTGGGRSGGGRSGGSSLTYSTSSGGSSTGGQTRSGMQASWAGERPAAAGSGGGAARGSRGGRRSGRPAGSPAQGR